MIDAGADHFARLGLPRRYALDVAGLEAAFLARSKEVHPDFHTLASPADQAASLDASAALNAAYATLKNPFRRADYLLTLLGGPTASEQKAMPPEFLEEVLELRMEIEEARDSHDEAAKQRLSSDLSQRRHELLANIATLFASWEQTADAALLPLLRSRLNSVKYIDGLLRDLQEP